MPPILISLLLLAAPALPDPPVETTAEQLSPVQVRALHPSWPDADAKSAIGVPDLFPIGPPASTDPLCRWQEVAPPQRSSMLVLPDPVGERFIAAGTNYGWSATWAFTLGDSPAWQRVDELGDKRFLESVVATVYDSHENRWILLANQYRRPYSVDTWTLEAGTHSKWTWLDSPTTGPAPSARQEFSAAFDSRRHRVLSFGGWTVRRTVTDEVWSNDLQSPAHWQQIEPASPGPSPRVRSIAYYDSIGDRLIVFGGLVPNGEYDWQQTSEMWALELSGTPQWTLLVPEGAAIVSAGTLLTDPVTHDLVAFSAYDTVSGAVGDWRLALHPEIRWTLLEASAAPEPHARFASVYDPAHDRFVGVPAGRVATDPLNLFEFRLRPVPSWKTLGSGSRPPPRFGQASAIDPIADRAYIYGGVTFAGGGLSYLDDIWSVSLANPERWTQILPSGDSPQACQAAAGIYDPLRHRFVVYGGWRIEGYTDTYIDELWVLELDGAPVLRKIVPTGEGPGGLGGHVAVLDPLRDRMIVMCGANDSGHSGETWALHLAEPMRWELLASSTDGPGSLWEPGAAYDPTRDRIVLHGGGAGGHTASDSWQFSLENNQWSRLQMLGYPPKLYRHRAVWDRISDRMLVMGGFDLDYDLVQMNSRAHALVTSPEPHWSYSIDRGSLHYVPSAATSLYDPRRDRVLGFGGFPGFLQVSNETWLLECGAGQERHAWLVGASNDEAGAHVTWEGANAPDVAASVERRGMNGSWVPYASVVSDEHGQWHVDDAAAREGRVYSYRLRIGSAEPSDTEVAVDISSASGLELIGSVPNPSRGSIALAFRLGAPGPATIELFDLAGRRVWSEHFTFAAAQTHILRVSAPLKPGLFLARLQAGGRVLTRRVVVLN